MAKSKRNHDEVGGMQRIRSSRKEEYYDAPAKGAVKPRRTSTKRNNAFHNDYSVEIDDDEYYGEY